jgi:hypothetical protein
MQLEQKQEKGYTVNWLGKDPSASSISCVATTTTTTTIVVFVIFFVI